MKLMGEYTILMNKSVHVQNVCTVRVCLDHAQLKEIEFVRERTIAKTNKQTNKQKTKPKEKNGKLLANPVEGDSDS